MSPHRARTGLRSPAAILALGLLVAACGSSEEEPAPELAATESASPTEEATDSGSAGPTIVSVTFDGNSCRYDGPSEIGPGKIKLEAVNESDLAFDLVIARIDEGNTHEEWLKFHDMTAARQGPPGYAMPFWGTGMAEPGMLRSERVPERPESGLYGLVCLADGGSADANPFPYASETSLTVTE